MLVHIPVQTVVDRSVHLAQTSTQTFVQDNAGNVVDVLERPVGGAYGGLPDDPSWYGARRTPARGGCHRAAPRVARRR